MKSERLLIAIGDIDEELIADARFRCRADRKRAGIRWGLAAACLALFIGAGTAFNSLSGMAAAGSFTMDVNPSVEYTVAKNGTVKDVAFLNSDAEKALSAASLEGRSVEAAVERTFEAYEACGYMQEADSAVLISFDERLGANAKLQASITEAVKDAAEQAGSVGTLVFHVDSGDAGAKAASDEFGISRGRADYILSTAEKTGITAEELLNLPLGELLRLKEEADPDSGDVIVRPYISVDEAKKIALKDAGLDGSQKVVFTEESLVAGGIKTPFYRLVFETAKTRWTYRIDATSAAILEKQSEDLNVREFISLEAAKDIALKDAGLDGSQKTVFTKEELNRNQGQPCYVLEFHTAQHQYAYKIDAKTGNVIEGGTYILLSEAKRIAIEDAGVDESQKIVFTEESLVAGGIKTPFYRLVFETAKTRWTYRIDATSAAILEKQSEDLNGSEFISLDAAKEIAIEDAGLDGSQKIVFTKEELNRNQGQPCYLLDFHTAERQYSCMVDAKTGAVLKSASGDIVRTPAAPEPEEDGDTRID